MSNYTNNRESFLLCMLRVTKCVSSLCFCGFILVNQTASAHSLADAMDATLQNNPRFLSYELTHEIAQQSRAEALAPFLPQVGVVMEDGDVLNKGVLGSGKSGFATSAYVNQSVFNGFSDLHRLQQNKFSVLASGQEFHRLRQGILIEVVRAYLEVIKDHQVVSLRRQIMDGFGKELKVAEKRFKLGEITKQEITKARSELAKAKANLLVAENDLKKANVSYEVLTGLNPLEVDLGYDRLEVQEAPESLDEALEVASLANPMVKMREYSIRASEKQLLASYGSLLPSVDVQLTKLIDRGDAIPQPQAPTNYVGLKVNIPIYSKGLRFSAIDSARRSLAKSKHDFRDANSKMRENIIRYYNDLKSSKAQISAEREAEVLFKLILATLKQEYDLKLASTTDVLGAENDLLEMRLRVINARHNYYMARYQLLQEMGSIAIAQQVR